MLPVWHIRAGGARAVPGRAALPGRRGGACPPRTARQLAQHSSPLSQKLVVQQR
ncbi:hypothetical protein [Arcanobacterium phocae]|uniref:hypothetical protein n=1 Tax=Arcanobacterium phocae TaxID=131112 RepID=UPI001C128B20|nr:hypothetical protein [Arcanobacterium phocae]